ncbi:ferredoxin C 1, chloroplastic-like [Castanea sativa]|uniref:ferredoxin C 1, chloroplastic-like n=1 Tax=Castanea sativa TaxID=21020 RepID=UPI003F650C57
MATLHFTPSPTLIPPRHNHTNNLSVTSFHLKFKPTWLSSPIVQSYKVAIKHKGQTTQLEVEPNETILTKALDSGLSIPHDCKLGVCMTCPARLLSGSVDQSDGMLSDDVGEQGYALLCAALSMLGLSH